MGLDRKTVRRYLEAIEQARIGDATEVDQPVLASLAQAVQERPSVEPSLQWQLLRKQRTLFRHPTFAGGHSRSYDG